MTNETFVCSRCSQQFDNAQKKTVHFSAKIGHKRSYCQDCHQILQAQWAEENSPWNGGWIMMGIYSFIGVMIVILYLLFS